MDSETRIKEGCQIEVVDVNLGSQLPPESILNRFVFDNVQRQAQAFHKKIVDIAAGCIVEGIVRLGIFRIGKNGTGCTDDGLRDVSVSPDIYPLSNTVDHGVLGIQVLDAIGGAIGKNQVIVQLMICRLKVPDGRLRVLVELGHFSVQPYDWNVNTPMVIVVALGGFYRLDG